MDDPQVRQRVTQRYATMLREASSEGYRAVGWGSQASQHKRFEVLSEIGDLRGKTILDVGCGLGAFHSWLLEQGIEHSYHGCDITAEMVARARTRTGLETIYHGDVSELPQDVAEQGFDYVFASGIFCFNPEGGLPAMLSGVSKMFALARRGIGFNSLSALADAQEADEFYAAPDECLKQCQHLSRFAVMRHDYHPADFTTYLYKDAP